jgi:hypothetical protein
LCGDASRRGDGRKIFANAMYQAILTVISTESQECHDSFVASPQPAQEFSSPALLTTLSF